MRAEKKLISKDYLERLQASPFFIVVDYAGLKVGPITDLRRRLAGTKAEMHVVKNSLFSLAVKEANLGDIQGTLAGQTAVVTGHEDVAATAKILKNFHAEFEKPVIKFGYLNDERMESETIIMLADLPPLDELRAQLACMINTPATQLARMLNAPAQQLAQVIKAKSEKGE